MAICPRVRSNQTGTIILHKTQIRNRHVRAVLMTPVVPNGPEVYSALDAHGWHPQVPDHANLNRIRRLLGQRLMAHARFTPIPRFPSGGDA